MEIGSSGQGHVAGGSAKKIGFLDFTNLDPANPFYPQSWWGAGINTGFDPGAPWQGCVYNGGTAAGTPPDCGGHIGTHGNAPGQLNSADEIAYAPTGGIFVLEGAGDKVLVLDGATKGVLSEWGVSGTGNGDLGTPASIVYHPDLGNLLISDPTNRRISEYDLDGTWVRSYGWGARTGDIGQFEVCGVGIAGCDPTPTDNANPRSWYTRLEVGPDRKLYALSDISDTMEVISFGGPTPGRKRIALTGRPPRGEEGQENDADRDPQALRRLA